MPRTPNTEPPVEPDGSIAVSDLALLAADGIYFTPDSALPRTFVWDFTPTETATFTTTVDDVVVNHTPARDARGRFARSERTRLMNEILDDPLISNSVTPPQDPPRRRTMACHRCQQETCRCVACNWCSERVDPVTGASFTHHDGWYDREITRIYHAHCAPQCERCQRRVDPNNQGLSRSLGDSGYMNVCGDCRLTCRGCRNVYMVRGAVQRECETCQENRRLGPRIQGYHHTTPTTWLGGPLPRNEKGEHVGFYIGFELEVSSTTNRIGSLNRWAEEHLGDPANMDCKSDSSVRGFEIATQPMTPEFFESVNWESFFEVLDRDHPSENTSPSREPRGHGLHVHVGRKAFERDDVAMAMFCYLIGQGDHLERIGRRAPTNYCRKVVKPAASAIVANASHKYNHLGVHEALYKPQPTRLREAGVRSDRDAINHHNRDTIEIRAFRSTRRPDDLRAAVRLVYLAARYIAHLRTKGFIQPKSLHWDQFLAWVETVMPEAVPMLRGPMFADQQSEEPMAYVVEEIDDEDYDEDYDDED